MNPIEINIPDATQERIDAQKLDAEKLKGNNI